MKKINKTFEELAKDKIGTIYYDVIEHGFRFVVLRGPASLCAYLGLPQKHPLTRINDYELLPLSCHYGLTYCGKGVEGLKDDNFFWWGWDYAHCDDKSFCDLEFNKHTTDKGWTVDDILADSKSTLYEFERFIKMAEIINRQ